MDEAPSWFADLCELLTMIYKPEFTLKEDRDDTLFEKFVTGLQQQVHSHCDLSKLIMKNDELKIAMEDFFNRVIRQNDQDLSYGIRIIAVLIGGFSSLEELNEFEPRLLKHWISGWLCKEEHCPSVAMSLLNVLTQVISLSTVSDSFLVDGVLNFCCNQLTNPSMFVRNGSKNVLVNVLSDERVKFESVSDVLTKLIEAGTSSPSCTTSLMTLNEAVKYNQKLCRVLQNLSIDENLLKFICSDGQEMSARCHASVLLARMASKQMPVLRRYADTMKDRQHYMAAVKFSAEVLKDGRLDSHLKDIIVDPIKMAAVSAESNEVDVVEGRKLLCSCLSCLIDVFSSNSDCVHIDDVRSVIKILTLTCDDDCPAVANSNKVRVNALNFLIEYTGKGKFRDRLGIVEFLQTWMKLMRKCRTTAILTSTIRWLKNLLVGDVCISDETMIELGSLLQQNLMNTRWEVQDSVVELVSELASSSYDRVHEWLIEQKFHVSFNDIVDSDKPNADVTASCITAISKYVKTSRLKEAVWNDCSITEEIFYDKLVLILEQSNDYTIRRAASKAMSAYVLKSYDDSYDENKVLRTMLITSCNDLDWTVKTNSLEFWMRLFENVNENCNAENRLRVLENTGFLSALMSAFKDHDNSIREAAAKILKRVQDVMDIERRETDESKSDDFGRDERTDANPQRVIDLPTVKSEQEAAINDVVNMEESTRLIRLLRECNGRPIRRNQSKFERCSVDEFLSFLKFFDYHETSKSFSKPADTYSYDFGSLIEDLTACITSVHDQDDVIVDCY